MKKDEKSCNSHVGQKKVGKKQDIKLAYWCIIDKKTGSPSGSIIHEFMHAWGHFHEHTRHDRDNYVQG